LISEARFPRPKATFNIINDKKKEGSRILGIDKTDRYPPILPPAEIISFVDKYIHTYLPS
jgi:hypothetical protein